MSYSLSGEKPFLYVFLFSGLMGTITLIGHQETNFSFISYILQIHSSNPQWLSYWWFSSAYKNIYWFPQNVY